MEPSTDSNRNHIIFKIYHIHTIEFQIKEMTLHLHKFNTYIIIYQLYMNFKAPENPKFQNKLTTNKQEYFEYEYASNSLPGRRNL